MNVCIFLPIEEGKEENHTGIYQDVLFVRVIIKSFKNRLANILRTNDINIYGEM